MRQGFLLEAFMNSVYLYFLTLVKSVLNTKTIIKLITTTVLKLSGFRAWLAGIILGKVVDKAVDKIEQKKDQIEDTDATTELKKEMLKDLKDIDWEKVDRLEREIMKGKP